MFTRPLNTMGGGRGVGLQNYRQYSQSPSVYIRLCKQDKNFTIASIKYFSKHRNKTMFICFHVKTPIDLSERVIDYLKYFIIIDLIAATWGWGLGRILAEGPSRVCTENYGQFSQSAGV